MSLTHEVTLTRPSQYAGSRVTYLLSQYPTFTHTFLLREVVAMRALGVDVRVISLTAADRAASALQPNEREEAAQTTYIKPRGAVVAILAMARAVITRPVQTARAAVRATRLAGWHPVRLAAHYSYLLQAAVVAQELLRTDAVHLHSHFCSTVGMLAADLTEIPWSFTIHGPAEFDDVLGFGLTEKVKSARSVVAISGFARSQVLRHIPPALWEKVVCVPLGIPLDAYTHPSPPDPRETLEILTVGRLANVKAQPLLIDAIAVLHAEGWPVRLRIVGDGPNRQLLAEQIRALGLDKVVELLGPLPSKEVTKLYATSDIFALPSFAEGVPVALMEAMAMERPCLATRLMGIPELIEDGVSGILVKPADVADTARGLRLLIADTSLRERIGVEGRRRVAQKYDLNQNVALLADVLFASREERAHASAT